MNEPCEKCQLACLSLHNSGATNHGLQTWASCNDVKTLNSKISALQDLLLDLTQRRTYLAQKMKHLNGGFLHRFPLEILTQIFTEFAETNKFMYPGASEYHLPVLTLGEVCSSWRGATLSIPQLWAKVTINPWKDSSSEWSALTKEWLDRSGGFPLSLTIKPPTRSLLQRYSKVSPTSAMELLRSHSSRWKRLDVRATPQQIHGLLNGVANLPVMDFLSIGILERAMSHPVAMKTPFHPTELSLRNVSISKIPFLWDRLTSFTANMLHIDEIVHIFATAINLKKCSILNVMENKNIKYKLPTTPIVHASLTSLDTYLNTFDTNYLRYVTFPALEVLNCSSRGLAEYEDEEEERVVEVFDEFMDRSKLTTLDFTLVHHSEDRDEVEDWYSKVQTITTLEFRLYGESNLERVEHLLLELGGSRLFPRLRELRLNIPCMLEEYWIWMGNMFPSSNDTDGETRPLKSVLITLQGKYDYEDPLMEQEDYHRIREIQEAGVEIRVLDAREQECLLESTARLYMNQGMEDDDDDEDEDEDDDEDEDEDEDGDVADNDSEDSQLDNGTEDDYEEDEES